ncbi:MAG: hypothetical protein WBX25_35835 [Rhodomicrobium sp.]
MRLIFVFTQLLFFTFACFSVSEAATIEVVPADNQNLQVIVLAGEIKIGDETRFADLAIGTQSAIVVLNSPGGSIYPAIEIGKTIRIKGFLTYVADGNECSSSCALIWLGGRRRSMSSRAKIGFHAAYTVSEGFASVNGPGNALVGAYVSQLGLPDAAVIYVTAAPPGSLHRLTPDDAKAVGLEIELFDLPAQPATNSSLEGKASIPLSAPRGLTTEQQAWNFVSDFLALDSSSEMSSIAEFSKRFEVVVLYYGKYMTNDAIVKDHLQFVSRWPKRSQTLKSGTLNIRCDPGGDKCQATALIDWTAESDPRNARSTGVSNWTITLSRSSDGLRIAAMNGKVLDRHISELRTQGLHCLFGNC